MISKSISNKPRSRAPPRKGPPISVAETVSKHNITQSKVSRESIGRVRVKTSYRPLRNVVTIQAVFVSSRVWENTAHSGANHQSPIWEFKDAHHSVSINWRTKVPRSIYSAGKPAGLMAMAEQSVLPHFPRPQRANNMSAWQMAGNLSGSDWCEASHGWRWLSLKLCGTNQRHPMAGAKGSDPFSSSAWIAQLDIKSSADHWSVLLRR